MSHPIKNHKKFLIILGAGPQQEKLYILAKAEGHNIVGVDIDQNACSKKYCDKFLNLSIKKSEQIINELKKINLSYSGVITCGAEVSPQVSAIALEFNLLGIPIDVALDTTDKIRRSNVLSKKRIRIPKFETVKNAKAVSIDLPVVIKPADSSGSRGVELVKNKQELEKAIENAKEISPSNRVICEEFIADGIEVSIEAFVLDSKPYITGIAERHFLDINETFPEFIEYGGTMPPTFSESLIEECKKVFTSAIKALNINCGPSKGDLIIKDGKVYVLEITSRTSPGFASEMQPLNSGIEPLRVLIQWATGNFVSAKNLLPKFNRGVAHRYYIHKKGKVKEIIGIDDLEKNKLVKNLLILNKVKINDYLGPVSYMNRILYIITEGKTNRTAIRRAERILDKIEVRTEE